jgi:hypothetical protein
MIPYLKRRFAPAPEQLALVNEHSVVSGDRLDNLASTHFGDAELYWICDANGAMRPDELTETVDAGCITMPAVCRSLDVTAFNLP